MNLLNMSIRNKDALSKRSSLLLWGPEASCFGYK